MIIQNRPAMTTSLTDHVDLCASARTVSGNVRLTCLFASFVFLQFTVLGLANHAGEGFLTTGQRELVYYVLQVFVILGFLLHAFFARFCMNGQNRSGMRKGIAYTVFGLFFACVAVMLLTGTDSLFYVIVSMIAALGLGGIGGAVHLRMSLETLTGATVARCMGIGSAVAVILQYLLQIRWGVTPLLPFFMLGALVLMAYCLPDKDSGTVAEGVIKTERTSSYRILLAVLITMVFVMFACFYNEYIHHLQIQSDYATYTVYSWPRLMLVPGYLLFAVIGDRKNGRYVPIASLCIMLIALLNVVLAQSPGSHWLNMCLFYFAIAASTSYYLLTFWRLAPGTEHPALWAPFGRIIDSAMVLLAGAIHLSTLPTPVILGMDIAGVALIILLMAISGNFNLSDPPAEQSTDSEEVSHRLPSGAANAASNIDGSLMSSASERPTSSGILSENADGKQNAIDILSEEEALSRIQEQYKLTLREAEVLRELVLTDDTQPVISERLSIRVRTLQNHVTQIYRKTGVTTRARLTDLYHETRLRT